MSDRRSCGICGRSRPEDDTTLVTGRRSGDYRRSSRRAERRVCRECTEHQVDYVRAAQTGDPPRNVPLDDHYINWHQAAAAFDIDVSDLWRNDYDRRRRAGEL